MSARPLEGRVALVSGGAQGIGAATAMALANAGAAVIIGDICAAKGEALATVLRDEGAAASFVTLDVADRAAWDAAVDHALAVHGRLDCLVNNAGIDIAHTIESATEADFRRILDVNLLGQFHGMQAAIPAMKAKGGGSIVNVASLATAKQAPTGAIYAPTKAAVASLTKTAAIHLAQTGSGIRVNSVHPGPTATAILLGADGNRAESPDIKAAIAAIPMARMGQPGEIGAVIVFLASDASSYMTGAELFIDGGLGLV